MGRRPVTLWVATMVVPENVDYVVKNKLKTGILQYWNMRKTDTASGLDTNLQLT
jgi:hypothetical protein